MVSSNEDSVISTSPLLCIQLRKTSNFGSVLKRRSLLGQGNDEYSISLSSSTSSGTDTSCSGINANSFECNMRNTEIIYDQLNALTKQDTTIYIIHDYIGRRQNRRKQTLNYDNDHDENEFTESADCDEYDLFQKVDEAPINTYNKTVLEEHDLNQVPDDDTMMDVDESCREKMCEWSYRICDHFHTSREIVAIAFNYLDRFNDVTRCDRTAFKLASMTCLYIATKICHNKQLSVHTLVDLSRNEFTSQNIIQMEQIILSTLDYKMNPPTVQIFLHEYQHIVPIHQILVLVNNTNHLLLLHSEYDRQRYITTKVMNDIFDRANYYSELVVYDSSLIIEQRQNIAISCLFNAIYDIAILVQDGDDCENYYEQQEKYEEFQTEFIHIIQTNISTLCSLINIDRINEIQERLWYLYSYSADYHQNQYNGYRNNSTYTTGSNHMNNTLHSKYNNSASSTSTRTRHNTKPSVKSHHENHVTNNNDAEFVTSGSPVCVIPIRSDRRVVTGMQPDQFSVRIF
jgi:hypothetical protein